jgi:hypothetical protein
MEQVRSNRRYKPKDALKEKRDMLDRKTPRFVVILTAVLLLLALFLLSPTFGQPMRTVRVDFSNMSASRDEIDALETNMKLSGVNTVALGAGRLDWNYFKWQNHENWWSQDVQDTGIDFLEADSKRFGKWAKVDVVVDVFAEAYIKEHPESAAISSLGKKSKNLVSTTELVDGSFGRQMLLMLDYISSNYQVDSISITELAYYTEGYGDDDKASYMSYSGRDDWPRHSDGMINIDDPSIGQWRSYQVGRFLERAANIVHKHGKKLYMDVEVSWGNFNRESTERGQSYSVMLKYVDKIIIWDYFGLNDYNPEFTEEIARYTRKYGADRVVISVGLWSKDGGVISPDLMRRAMRSSIEGGISNLWITPSNHLSKEHWEALAEVWGQSKSGARSQQNPTLVSEMSQLRARNKNATFANTYNSVTSSFDRTVGQNSTSFSYNQDDS